MKEFVCKKSGKLSSAISENLSGISYGNVMKLLRKKDVKVNGVRVKKDVAVNVGDKITVYTEVDLKNYSVVFRDENVIVIDKKRGCLSETVFENLKEDLGEVYFIHRLDRNTSGIMIFALNRRAEEELLLGFKKHGFIKEYLAEVIGKMPKNEDILTAYLIKDKDRAEVKIFDEKVKGSSMIKTGYKVIFLGEKTSILSVRLFTGKTHQIRAHLAHVGHPIVGDEKYGDSAFNKLVGTKKQRLTAKSLTLCFSPDEILYYLNGKTFTAGDM